MSHFDVGDLYITKSLGDNAVVKIMLCEHILTYPDLGERWLFMSCYRGYSHIREGFLAYDRKYLDTQKMIIEID